jgi:16S rRNA (cytosine967-C5)-methyltransferase
MNEYSHIKIMQALEIIRGYAFNEPLHIWLKKYFLQKKKMGSRDRKHVKMLIYSWFRIGRALPKLDTIHRIKVAVFLTHSEEDPLIRSCIRQTPFEETRLDYSLDEKLALVKESYPDFDWKNIFPFHNLLSEAIDKEEFAKSFLTKPHVWMRFREEFKEEVLKDLDSYEITHFETEVSKSAFGFEATTELTKMASYSRGYFEIQDLSSQMTGEFFDPKSGEHWYDCCAASGGKSLMLHSKCNDINLVVSDTRKAILNNLNDRFKKVGLTNYTTHQIEIGKDAMPFHGEIFDAIIVDAPCSGSGTWTRTPDSLLSFKKSQLTTYVELQKNIVESVIPFLKKGGRLFYITCSVFQAENEDQVEQITNLGFTVVQQKIIPGYTMSADTMFMAYLSKN